MDLGIYGGTFNPPHLAHLIIAETVRDQFGLDRVLWVPSGQPPHKNAGDLAAPHHRLAMTRLAVEENPHFAVSEVEVAREGPSYTVDTLDVLQRDYPGAALHLLIGGDSLSQLASWYRPEAILERARLAVYNRPGADLSDVPDRIAARARFAASPLLAISGTEIRARLRRGASIRYLVPEAVRAYIRVHRLYGGEEGRGEREGGRGTGEEEKRRRGGEE